MKPEAFEQLTASVQQMKAIRAGNLRPARVTQLSPDHPRAVRVRLKLTQEAFSDLLGVPLGTLRNWEQGHRSPGGAARALLRIAAKHPALVRKALAAA